jgi:hypothetical protein
MLKDGIVALNKKPKLFHSRYNARATGAEALLRLEGHAVAAAVRAEREAHPVTPFCVIEAAYALRGRMSTKHDKLTSWCRVETYNVYWERHYLLKLHAGLPPLPRPFKRPVDKADGHERSCRLCKPTTKGAK